MDPKENYDINQDSRRLSQEETTQRLRWEQSDDHAEHGERGQVDRPHSDNIGNNKVSTSLDEDSAS